MLRPLLLLSLCSLLGWAQAYGCAVDEACIYVTRCGDSIEKVDQIEPPTGNDTTCEDGQQLTTLRIRPTDDRSLTIKVESTKNTLGDVEFSLNGVEIQFLNENEAAISGDAESGIFSISSKIDEPFAAVLKMVLQYPTRFALADLKVITQNQTWPLPGFAERLHRITPCDQKCRDARAAASVGSTCSESDLKKACDDCGLHVTPLVVTCDSKLRVDIGSLFLHHWVVADEIVCRDNEWNWREENKKNYKAVENRKVHCSEKTPPEGTTVLWWTIGVSIVVVIVLFFAVGACCYYRIKRKAANSNPGVTSRDTSLGAVAVSASDAEPKTWKWPAPDSKRVVVNSECARDTTTGANRETAPSPVGVKSPDEKSQTIEGTTFSAKTMKSSKKERRNVLNL